MSPLNYAMTDPPVRFDASRRSAFSLLEILLVLVLIVIVFTLTVPRLAGFTLRNELTSAARQVQSTLTRARNDAMRTGNPVMVVYQPQSNVFSRAEVPIDQASTMAFQTIQSTVIQVAGSEQRLRAADLGGASAIGNVRRLPGEVVFLNCSSCNLGNSAATESATSNRVDAGQAMVSLPSVVFRPDGTSTNRLIVLANIDGEQIALAIRGLTGIVQISEVASSENPIVAGANSP